MTYPEIPGFLRRGGRPMAVALAAVIGWALPSQAQSGAVIFNSDTPALQTVALGVNDLGHLNFSSGSFNPVNASATGLSYLFSDGSWRDVTAPGCLCEGWGLAVTPFGSLTPVSGYANVSGGTSGLSLGTFNATSTSATSVVSLTGANVGVTHEYSVSSVPNVFKGRVTITNNTGSAIQDIVYRRAMDWDVPPTEFNEFVTHRGVVGNLESSGGNIRFASDNGFATSNPLVPAGEIQPSTNIDFDKLGPRDQGSVFDFSFGDLAAGESREFNIYYGAFGDRPSAQAGISSLLLNVYSLGQSGLGGAANDGAPTFVFGFEGVGSFIPDPPNPDAVPGPLPLLGFGAGLAWSRALRRRVKAAESRGAWSE